MASFMKTGVIGRALGVGCWLVVACGGKAQPLGAADDGGALGSGGEGSRGLDAYDWGPPPSSAPERMDLLLVVDNSLSMADKQALLSQAVPQLVRRLITPNCLDGNGSVLGTTDAAGRCDEGAPEFPAVTDLH